MTAALAPLAGSSPSSASTAVRASPKTPPRAPAHLQNASTSARAGPENLIDVGGASSPQPPGLMVATSWQATDVDDGKTALDDFLVPPLADGAAEPSLQDGSSTQRSRSGSEEEGPPLTTEDPTNPAAAAAAAPAEPSSAAAPRREGREDVDFCEETPWEDADEVATAPVVPTSSRAPMAVVALHSLCDIRLVDLKAWPEFFDDMREDIERECKRHGDVVSVWVDKTEPKGAAWVRYAAPGQAQACQASMSGRRFAGSRISAELHGCDAWPGGSLTPHLEGASDD
mmetsp:Transcript_28712/g.80682  ORF Transcript_28712/g.80682 Transcript_28712/m.80682 type:complete len:285 (-) Transcript_28712:90-944(-)